MKKVYALIVIFSVCTILSNTVTAKPGYDGRIPTSGIGIGRSYGGIGVRFQWRFGGIVGGGIHFGGGYFPAAPFGVSIGAKFYAYKGLYLNAQYGTVETFTYSNYRSGSSSSVVYYGSSFLIGEDIMFGQKKRLGINFAVGISLQSESKQSLPAADLGFLVRL